MINGIHDPESHGIPPSETERTPLNCDDDCGHPEEAMIWLEESDKWCCDSCLIDYFCDEIDSLIGIDDWSEVPMCAFETDTFEFAGFSYFTGAGLARTERGEITLNELEGARN